MNERLKELADHAGLGHMFNRNENKSPGMCRPEDLEKFAELIVKECAALTLDYKNDQHYNGWLDYRHQIREHFGVES